MNSEQTKIGAGSPSLSTPLFCAACGSRKRGQHSMGCRVGIEKGAALTAQTTRDREASEAALLCSIRAPPGYQDEGLRPEDQKGDQIWTSRCW
jgi:hypothetical protein